jgi:hypothetical protein
MRIRKNVALGDRPETGIQGEEGGKRMPGSYAGTTAGYTTAPRIVPERGEIWFAVMDAGFFVTRFAVGVWPFRP